MLSFVIKMLQLNIIIDCVLLYRFVIYLVSLVSVKLEPLRLLLQFLYDSIGGGTSYHVIRCLLLFIYLNLAESLILFKLYRYGFSQYLLKTKFFINLVLFCLLNLNYIILGVPELFRVYSYILGNLVITHLYSEIIPRYAIDGGIHRYDRINTNQSV